MIFSILSAPLKNSGDSDSEHTKDPETFHWATLVGKVVLGLAKANLWSVLSFRATQDAKPISLLASQILILSFLESKQTTTIRYTQIQNARVKL